MSININALVSALRWLTNHPVLKQKHEMMFDMTSEGGEPCLVISLYPANVHIEVFYPKDGDATEADVIFGDGGSSLDDSLDEACIGSPDPGNLKFLKDLFRPIQEEYSSRRFQSIPELIYSLMAFFIVFETHGGLDEVVKNNSFSSPF